MQNYGVNSSKRKKNMPEKITIKVAEAIQELKDRAVLPTDAAARKLIPLCTGLLDYFPAALAEVAKVSLQGNIQHNGPDSPLFWARGKSMDQSDTILRHLAERGKIDTDGMRHSAKVAWRALALLQLELEEAGAPLARGAKLPEEPKK
jgi:hypothetical protein